MSWRLAKALTVLRAEVDAAHPGRDKTSDGTVADSKHATTSDHSPKNTKHPGVVTAWDCDEDDGTVGRRLWDFLLAGHDPRVKYVIYERQMFSSYRTSSREPWTPGPYTGSNPHDKHLHISLDDSPHLYDLDRPWGYHTIEEDDVLQRGDSGLDVKYVQEQLNRVLSGRHDTGPLVCDGDFGPATEAAVNDAQARLGWDQNGIVTAFFADRLLHVVLYGDIKAADPPDEHNHDGQYAPHEHGHSAVVTVK